MFEKARIKLTFWYLLVIMIVSVFFSTFIYLGASREIYRVVSIEQFRTTHPDLGEKYIQRPVWDIEQLPIPRTSLDPRLIQDTRVRVAEGLVLINLIILFFSTLAGYFLAGRTLRPIKEMVDDQNRFITDASHELNTPLTSLKTSIEVNLRDKNFNLEKAKKVLKGNLEDIDNLQSLSDKLIKLTQYQNSNGSLKFEELNITSVIDAAFERVKSMALDKQINFNLNTKKTLVMGDEKNLTELFVILFDNAIKYSKAKKSVKVKNVKIDSKIEIFVEDEGMGISKEDLPHIFDRFYRADKSRTKQQVAGYGLGLSIAKRIVDIHNGEISVHSVPSKKTIFKIVLPAV